MIRSAWFNRVDSDKVLPIGSRSLRGVEENLVISSRTLLCSSKNLYRGSIKNRLDFLIHCLGLSVTLGNIWRFPYLAYENEGFKFLIPYIILVLTAGNSLFYLEVAIGQYSGRGPIILGEMIPLGKGLAVAMSYISILTLTYYGALMTHCMTYILTSFYSELPWTHCISKLQTYPTCVERIHKNITGKSGFELITPAEDFYNNHVLQMGSLLESQLGSVNKRLLLYLAISWFIVFIILAQGTMKRKQIAYIAIVAPSLMLGILLLVALQQKGARIGIDVLLNPVYFDIPDVETWRKAAEQMFFSLDVSTGNLIIYGACCDFRSSSLKDIVFITTFDLAVSVASGAIVFCVIGALSYETNIDFYYVMRAGAGLAFVCFSELVIRTHLPRFCNFVIFVCFYIVCFATQLLYLDPVFSTLYDIFPELKPKKTVIEAIVCFLLFMLGIPCITKSGIFVITLMDNIGAAFALIFIGSLEALFVTGIYGVHRFSEDIHFMLGCKPNIAWKILWVLCPTLLLLILLQNAVKFYYPLHLQMELPMSLAPLVWLACLIAVLIVVGMALYQAMSYFLRGELRNVLRPTGEWCPDDEVLAKVRNIFDVFSSSYAKGEQRQRSRQQCQNNFQNEFSSAADQSLYAPRTTSQ